MSLNETDGVVVSAEKYREDGLLKRVVRMMKGLSRPRDSREYKEALIELQRLVAPLAAILLPALAVVVLIVVSAVNSNKPKEQKLDIWMADNEKIELIPVDPPKPDDAPVKPDVEIITEFKTDIPEVGDPSQMAGAVEFNRPDAPRMNSLDDVKQIRSPVSLSNPFQGTRPGGKGVPPGLTTGGGSGPDPNTEGAVLKALRWLKHTQNADGSWNGPSKPAMTGFAVLTYLAHGETPSHSREFGLTVRRAIEYLVGSTVRDGERVVGFAGMDGNQYAFPIATYALAEAYGMTQNPEIGAVAEKCLARIIENQSSTGGWDYKLDWNSNRDDTSFGGWCIQAIKAGKMAGLHPDGIDECIKKAIACLRTRAYSEKLGFKYTADSPGGGGLAGVGCLAMQLLGYGREPAVRNALGVMRDWLPSFDRIEGTDASPQYYCYYAAQCKYQAGMAKSATKSDAELWKKWSAAMKKLYPGTIITLDEKIADADGKLQEMGYWQNKDQHDKDRTMGTCLAALQLMVYYRYLPTTQLKAAEVEVDINEATKDATDVPVTVDF